MKTEMIHYPPHVRDIIIEGVSKGAQFEIDPDGWAVMSYTNDDLGDVRVFLGSSDMWASRYVKE